ncbi:NADH-quinone oxidoreductase subunit H [Ktedonobacteria bacterium brp13]|nr:NADH-quinone oxidoreductase subunit H [Ktedonobacteria bacterium brp13]
MMIIIANTIWEQLYQGIFSLQFVQFIITLIFAILFPITSAAVINFLERKVIAWMQDRVGPYHTGPWGTLQLVADIIKMLTKEDVHSARSDKALFLLAPATFVAPMIAAFAVLPFSPFIGLPGSGLATGIIYLVAVSSIDIIGIIMAGWGSNSKYALIGGMRGAAQMISYELPLVLSLIGIIMLTSILAGLPGYPGNNGIGTISIREIISFQNLANWPGKGIPFFDFIFEGNTPWGWFFLIQPLMLLIYYICGLAETNRSPFDLPEAESELVAGHMTEYSGLRWGFFFLGEYGNMTVVAGVITTLFLGGWAGPGVGYLTATHMSLPWQIVGNILGTIYFITKIYLLSLVFIWIRGTLPRLRADQLMQFSWLILIPVTLGNILLLGLLYLITSSLGLPILAFLGIAALMNWTMLIGFIFMVSSITHTATRRAQAPALRALLRRTGTIQAKKAEKQLTIQ